MQTGGLQAPVHHQDASSRRAVRRQQTRHVRQRHRASRASRVRIKCDYLTRLVQDHQRLLRMLRASARGSYSSVTAYSNPMAPEIRITVAIPTLAADSNLARCIRSLAAQTRRDFAIVVVDNSGQRLARQRLGAGARVEIIENNENRGFGAAINQVYSRSNSPFLAVLNDDAVADPHWLSGLLDVIESRPDAGMCASQVRLLGSGQIDSAGMLICGDGSSKQRGHLRPPEEYRRPEEVLLPSGSAALYRRA